jgi:hypothetical protein
MGRVVKENFQKSSNQPLGIDLSYGEGWKYCSKKISAREEKKLPISASEALAAPSAAPRGPPTGGEPCVHLPAQGRCEAQAFCGSVSLTKP